LDQQGPGQHHLLEIRMSSLVANAIIAMGSVYAKLVPGSRLSEAIRSSERALIYNRDEAAKVAKLADRKILTIDVGARGGLAEYLERYRPWLDVVMVEPDPIEAERLRKDGFTVVEALIAGHSGEAVLNCTRNPANASMLEPTGAALAYYTDNYDRFEILARPLLPAMTLDKVEQDLGRAIDYIKLDTQGSELAILEGGVASRPLIIASEVSGAQLYKHQGLFFDIGKLLQDRGYIMFDFAMRSVRPAGMDTSTAGPSLGVPMHGDAYFMPDWSRDEGRALIAARPRTWAALMVMHGMEEIVRFAMKEGKIPGLEAVREVLFA
jgi:FkbM family methyltransferase